MKKLFLYIDESKSLKDGILILGGFLSPLNRTSCNKHIEGTLGILNLEKIKELKSTSRYGKEFIEKGGLGKLTTSNLIHAFVGTIYFDYYRDSYKGYCDALIQLIQEIDNNIEISGVFIDDIPVVSNRQELKKCLERDICGKFSNIKNITPECSENQRSIQLADLVTGKLKEYYRFRENISLNELIGDSVAYITKKNSLEVTSSSVLLAQAP